MVPNVNFDPSFTNLAALRNLGGMPHPAGPPLSRPMSFGPPPMTGPMPGGAPIYSGLPAQQYAMQPPAMPGQFPQGNLSNLHALMQILGRQ